MSTKVAEQQLSAAERLSGIAGSYVVTAAINAVIRLNIADLIGDEQKEIAKLAAKTQTNEDALYRVLRLLCSMDIFAEVLPRVFANNDASHSMRSDARNSQRAMLEFITDPFHMQVYADMLPTIKSGRTAVEHLFNKNVFEVFKEDPDTQRRFDDAMTSMSKRALPAVLQEYDFSGIETLVDVAGGHALLLTGILQKYPNMKGVLFDMPHVVPGAQKRIEELGLSDRCRTVGGDFFQSVPSGNAYIMKHIIHDWDDDRAITILKNCHKAMNKEGARKLLLVEMIVPDTCEPHPSYFLDIEMLMLPGGRERTTEEFRALLDKAGFKLNRVVSMPSPLSVIEALPV